PAWYELGNTLAEAGDLDGALRNYRKAVELRPRYAEAYNRIGEILLGKGDTDGARSEFRKALKANPWYTPASENLKKAP
ncbi:MAG TPA: tetratricopeptide repeat protein, partial [Spirochaetota bacterium]|nr:tetratricopeptide repeat protein [Spirochaetota bacterium]